MNKMIIESLERKAEEYIAGGVWTIPHTMTAQEIIAAEKKGIATCREAATAEIKVGSFSLSFRPKAVFVLLLRFYRLEGVKGAGRAVFAPPAQKQEAAAEAGAGEKIASVRMPQTVTRLQKRGNDLEKHVLIDINRYCALYSNGSAMTVQATRCTGIKSEAPEYLVGLRLDDWKKIAGQEAGLYRTKGGYYWAASGQRFEGALRRLNYAFLLETDADTQITVNGDRLKAALRRINRLNDMKAGITIAAENGLTLSYNNAASGRRGVQNIDTETPAVKAWSGNVARGNIAAILRMSITGRMWLGRNCINLQLKNGGIGIISLQNMKTMETTNTMETTKRRDRKLPTLDGRPQAIRFYCRNVPVWVRTTRKAGEGLVYVPTIHKEALGEWATLEEAKNAARMAVNAAKEAGADNYAEFAPKAVKQARRRLYGWLRKLAGAAAVVLAGMTANN